MSPWRVFWTALAIGAVIVGVALLAMPARAQSSLLCAPLPDLLAGLRKGAGEWVVMTSDMAKGRLYMTRNDDSGAWTIVVAVEDVGCIVMAGTSSEILRGF